jgi:iron complex outermembrane recepter protein
MVVDLQRARDASWSAAATIVTLLVGFPGLSFAQSTSAGASQQAEEGGSQEGGTLGEIVVTAEKREERLQDVPVSINAVSGDSMLTSAIQETTDLANSIPGLTFSGGLNGNATIRGVGAPVSTAGNQSAVPIYQDGVLLISPLQGTLAFNNVERVEVLEGPQGTLFGRNAAGGVISIVTADPGQKLSGNAMISYGNYQQTEAQVYVNIPLTDTLAANVAGYYYCECAGWGRDEFTGQDNTDNQKFYDFRTKLGWNPSDATSVILTYDHSFIHEEIDSRILPGTIGLFDAPPPTGGLYDTTEAYRSYNGTEVNLGSLRVTTNLGGGITFRSITADTDVKTYWPFDSEPGSVAVIQGPIFDDESGFTQEFQFLSPTDQKITWIAGLFYLYDDAKFAPIQLVGAEFGPATINVYGDTIAQSYAPFAQTTWEFLPGAHLTLGGRDTYDYRSVNGHTDVDFVHGTEYYQQTSFRTPTYKVSLDYRFSPEVMTYATLSTGFNSGQYNTGSASTPPVLPEKITAYEIGAKTNLLGDRLRVNASAFWYNYKDLQVSTTAHAVTVQTNAAAAQIKGAELSVVALVTRNLQLNADVTYLDDYYTNYLGATVYVPAPGPGYGYTTQIVNADGQPLPNTPKLSSSVGAKYNISTWLGPLDATVLWAYRDTLYESFLASSFRTPASNTLNASITLHPSPSWYVSLWGRNLTQDDYLNEGVRLEFAGGAPDEPREYGLRFGYQFGM